MHHVQHRVVQGVALKQSGARGALTESASSSLASRGENDALTYPRATPPSRRSTSLGNGTAPSRDAPKPPAARLLERRRIGGASRSGLLAAPDAGALWEFGHAGINSTLGANCQRVQKGA